MLMIILLYFIVIFGWALIILTIKCKKAREKRIALAQQEAQTQNAVHVIQIGNTLYDVIPISGSSPTRCRHHSHWRRGIHLRYADSSSSLNNDNSHTNQTFVHDEGVYPSDPTPAFEAPPSYDEVIRLPNQYPKLNSVAVTPINENPPPTIAEIEANGHSIVTISSMTPAIITNQQSEAANRSLAT